MQSNNNKVWAFLGLVIVVVLIVVGIKSSKNGKISNETGPIKIGVVGPFTGDGATYGVPARDAVKLAADEINAKGGIKGRQVKLVMEDGKCDGKSASLAAQKLISVDKVQVIIGGLCSGETMAMAPIAEEAKVLLISDGSSAPAITDSGDYIFRLAPSDLASAAKLVELMSAKGYKKVAVISEQTDYSQGIGKAFVQDAKNAGIEVVYDESFATDINDFKPFATKINTSGAEAVFVNPQTGAGATKITKALREQGNEAQFYNFFITEKGFVEAGSFVNGTIIVDMGAVANQKLGAEFLNKFKTTYNRDPEYALFATLGYDTANIVFQAISKVGDDATKIKDYLYKMPTYTGITGNLSFDKNGDPVGNNVFVIKQIQDGKLVELK